MEPNKYDLCHDTVTLDYTELLRTAYIAVHFAKEELLRSLDRFYDYSTKEPLSPVYVDYMKSTADQLAQASITLHHLYHGQLRPIVKVENHPTPPED